MDEIDIRLYLNQRRHLFYELRNGVNKNSNIYIYMRIKKLLLYTENDYPLCQNVCNCIFNKLSFTVNTDIQLILLQPVSEFVLLIIKSREYVLICLIIFYFYKSLVHKVVIYIKTKSFKNIIIM